MITVDAEKLSRGLNTVFKGVAVIFESIGAEYDPGIMGDQCAPDHAEDKTVLPETKPDEKNSDSVKQKKTEETKEGENTASASSAPALTLDDITKVIVQKIRKDRGNNEKIGQILKTFNVSKVSELPADKYEAFLTELAAL